MSDNNRPSMIVSDYNKRDIHDKNAALMGMALSQLDNDNIFQFTQRILMEAKKYDDSKLEELTKQIDQLYFGNGIPHMKDDIIPLYHLKPDKKTEENIILSGIRDDSETGLKTKLPRVIWSDLKKSTTRKIFDVSVQIINRINNLNNFSTQLRNHIEQINELRKKLDESIDKDPETLINYEYIDKDNRIFSTDRKDFITFENDSPDPKKRKYKVYSRDYFYNLRHFVSQAFNSTLFRERMFHLATVANFISNKMYTKSKDEIFMIEPSNRDIFVNFVRLVYNTSHFSEMITNHQYLTSDERLAISSTLSQSRSSLMIAGTKLMSLVNYILTIVPYQKKTTIFDEAEL